MRLTDEIQLITNTKNLSAGPITDTFPAALAIREPKHVLDRFSQLSSLVWLSDTISSDADSFINKIFSSDRAVWFTVSGPFGFGKTATALALASRCQLKGLSALPPLAAIDLDEYLDAVCALLCTKYPNRLQTVRGIRKSIDEQISKSLKGQRRTTEQAHRFIDFLAQIAQSAEFAESPLVIVLDEVQQLLGTLDSASLSSFRELVWGLRTDRVRCGVILCMDNQLETRMERWAADILHRIRESGYHIKLETAYDRTFPEWLWPRWSVTIGESTTVPHPDLLMSLGQYVERWDLANGPRTIVDVFARAIEAGVDAYGPLEFVEDIRRGIFKYFAEGSGFEAVLNAVLADNWIAGDQARKTLVQLLGAFPNGCPDAVLEKWLPSDALRKVAINELFGPLLIRAECGLALEPLQRVRRPLFDLDDALANVWGSLPALDALVEHMPGMIKKILLPSILDKVLIAAGKWIKHDSLRDRELDGWDYYQGTFNDDFPDRVIAIWVGTQEPTHWPDQVDLAVYFHLNKEVRAEYINNMGALSVSSEFAQLRLVFPVLLPISQTLPAEIDRFKKFLAPEPFRPATLMAAVAEIQRRINDKEVSDNVRFKAKSFVHSALEIVSRVAIRGQVEAGLKKSVQLSGVEYLRAQFVQAMRRRYPKYIPLPHGIGWRERLAQYRAALEQLADNQSYRLGDEPIAGKKGEIYLQLFQQDSTAAGDSFIRGLGQLIIFEENGRNIRLRFHQHPGEIELKRILQESRHDKLPRISIIDNLLCSGWTSEEAHELVQIAIARGSVWEIEQGMLAIKQGENSFSPIIAKGEEAKFESSGVENHFIEELEGKRELLFQQIGILRAINIPTNWTTSGLSVHLTGISKELIKIHGNLLLVLRKLANELTQVNEIATWKKIRSGASSKIASISDRITQFQNRARRLVEWKIVNDQLAMLETKISRIQCYGLESRDISELLDAHVTALREQFATRGWKPLEESDAALKCLDSVEEAFQKRTFDHLFAFQRMRTEFNMLVGWASSTAPPDYSFNELDPFSNLMDWALASCESALDSFKGIGFPNIYWGDPMKTKLTLRETLSQAEKVLRNALETRSDEDIRKTVRLISRLADGFGNSFAFPQIYRNKEAPLNFEALRKAYLEGKVEIQIRPI